MGVYHQSHMFPCQTTASRPPHQNKHVSSSQTRKNPTSCRGKSWRKRIRVFGPVTSVSLSRLVLRSIGPICHNMCSPIPRKFTGERPQCPRWTQNLLHDDCTGPVLPCPLHRGSFCLLRPHPGLHLPGSRHRGSLCSPLWLFLHGNRNFIRAIRRAFPVCFGHKRSGERTPLISSRQPSHQSGQYKQSDGQQHPSHFGAPPR